MATVRRELVRAPYPSVLWLVVSYLCNRHCDHCYAKAAQDRSPMPEDVADAACRFVSHWQPAEVVIIGGEPTLFPDLLPLVRRLRQGGVACSIVTNGARLSSAEFCVGLREAGVSRVHISLDGAASSGQEDDVRAARQAVHVWGPSAVSAVLTVSSQPAGMLEEAASQAAAAGVEQFAVNYAVPAVNARGPERQPPCEPLEGARRMAAIWRHLTYRLLASTTVYLTPPLCLFPDEFLRDVARRSAVATGCHVFTGGGVVVDPQGGVLPCTHWVDHPYANLLSDRAHFVSLEAFNRFWSTGPPARLASRLFGQPPTRCASCRRYGPLCVGGCPLIWLQHDPDVVIGAPPP
jgi:radical SAM protein with 4Fe4S-binding SPASM domain